MMDDEIYIKEEMPSDESKDESDNEVCIKTEIQSDEGSEYKYNVKDEISSDNYEENIEKKYKCKFCNKKFTRKEYLPQHLNTHTNTKKYKCKFCDKSFNNPSNKERHVKVSHLSKINEDLLKEKCDLCHQKFICKSRLKQHLQFKHNLQCNNKKFSCKICGSSFKSQYHLKDHMYKHDDFCRFICLFCKKAYKYKQSLSKHLKKCKKGMLSSDDKRHAYKECAKSFESGEEIIKIETKMEKNIEYNCGQCFMSFTLKQNLKRHLLSRCKNC